MKSIIGRKMGMTEVFAQDGTMYPVTVVEVLPNAVTAKKTKEKDGYEAIQVGYEDMPERKANKAEAGNFKKAGVSPKEHLYELKGDEIYSKNVGETIDASIFQAGEVVDVIGTTKGHGYAGTIKRYHHHIGPITFSSKARSQDQRRASSCSAALSELSSVSQSLRN